MLRSIDRLLCFSKTLHALSQPSTEMLSEAGQATAIQHPRDAILKKVQRDGVSPSFYEQFPPSLRWPQRPPLPTALTRGFNELPQQSKRPKQPDVCGRFVNPCAHGLAVLFRAPGNPAPTGSPRIQREARGAE